MSDDRPVHVARDRYPEPVYTSIAPKDSDLQSADELNLLEYWDVLSNRRWTILAIVLTAVIGTLIWTFKQPLIYNATALIQIDRENPNVLTFEGVYELESMSDDTLRTQFEVLKSRVLARTVIEDLQLDREEEFQPGEPSLLSSYIQYVKSIFIITDSTGPPDDPDPYRSMIDGYLGRLTIAPIRQSRLVNVSFEATDPELAARVINAHSEHFIEQNLRFKYEATQDASDFLSTELVSLQVNLERSEENLQDYSRQNQILFTVEGRNTAMEKLRQIEEEYTQAQADRFRRESYKDLDTEVLPQVMKNQLVAGLFSRVAELRREESELAVTFAEEYPHRKRIHSQIDELQRIIEEEKARVVETVEAEYDAAVERESLLEATSKEQTDVVNRINQEIIHYGILEREVESNRQLYDGLLMRLKEAGVSAGLRSSNIRIVDRAEVPRSPIKPRKRLNLLVSLAAGLIFGVGVSFFQEFLDNSIKSPEEAAGYLGIPALGLIPILGNMGSSKRYGYGSKKQLSVKHAGTESLTGNRSLVDLVSHEAPSSIMAEAYRSIRTSLLLSSPDRAPQVILVTSSVASEGKTSTAVNLAISLTQMGSRVVVVDSDMRKPRIHSTFSISSPVGLSSFLTASLSLREVIHETEIPNLSVIPCGLTPPNPGELVLSTRFGQMMEVLREYFDFVVLDSPPLLNVSDARVLAVASDTTILVVKAFATSKHQIRPALEELTHSRARLAGVVLNQFDTHQGSSYYPYYKNYYAYQSQD